MLSRKSGINKAHIYALSGEGEVRKSVTFGWEYLSVNGYNHRQDEPIRLGLIEKCQDWHQSVRPDELCATDQCEELVVTVTEGISGAAVKLFLPDVPLVKVFSSHSSSEGG